MSVDLKPCPFCGSEDVEIVPIGDVYPFEADSNSVQGYCSFCGCLGPEKETEAEATRAWNCRAR